LRSPLPLSSRSSVRSWRRQQVEETSAVKRAGGLNELYFEARRMERAMLPQILIAFGAALFGLLGTIQIVYTFFTNKFEARDGATSAAMKATSPLLTKRTSLWNAWIGFNASHGVLLLFAAPYLLLSVRYNYRLRAEQYSRWHEFRKLQERRKDPSRAGKLTRD
jgi:hypothetical protein